MARRSDPDARPKRQRGVLRHYRRPVWKDRLFWLVGAMSVLVTAAFVAVILVITGIPETPLGWARPVLLGLAALLLSFRLLGAGVTTSRHFQRGLGEGSAPRPNDLEAKGRAAGAVVGRAVRAARTPSAKTSTAEPEPEPATAASAPQTDTTPPGHPFTPEQVTPEQVTPEQVTAEHVAPEPVAADPEPVTTDTGPEPVAPATDPVEPEPEPVPAARTEPDPAATPAEPTPAEPTPAEPTPAEPTPTAKPKVTSDAAARSIGSMVGRRMAERRKKP